MTTGALPLAFRAVDRATWPDFVRLFESRGAPKHCWCMALRPMPREGDGAGRPGGAERRAAMEAIVAAATPVGILGSVDGEPVAWCSIAPRATYRPLGGPADDTAADADADVTWSLVCFFVQRGLRGRGVTRGLIAAAIDYARSRGARVVEAYPVDPESPSYRFGGFVATFAAMGFVEVGRAGTRRHVMRYRVE